MGAFFQQRKTEKRLLETWTRSEERAQRFPQHRLTNRSIQFQSRAKEQAILESNTRSLSTQFQSPAEQLKFESKAQGTSVARQSTGSLSCSLPFEGSFSSAIGDGRWLYSWCCRGL